MNKTSYDDFKKGFLDNYPQYITFILDYLNSFNFNLQLFPEDTELKNIQIS